MRLLTAVALLSRWPCQPARMACSQQQKETSCPAQHGTWNPSEWYTLDFIPLPPTLQLGAEGKRLRPTMLLLLASSLSTTAPSAAMLTVDETPHSSHPTDTRRRQQRIAEITEMIHVASLLHDDVIDSAETRRGLKALNSVMGNKVWEAACMCLSLTSTY